MPAAASDAGRGRRPDRARRRACAHPAWRATRAARRPIIDAAADRNREGAKFLPSHEARSRPIRLWEIALKTFSPREIQSRVRAGATAEDVADDTGWPLDKVLRYAEPLLAERAYIAEQALAVEVRRSGGGASLRQAAAAAVGASVESDAIAWDAWRREDGKWVVAATYAERGKKRTALWTYDHAGRNIHPLDDNARTLMGVRGLGDHDDIADALDLVSDPVEESRPRLVAVPDSDEEQPGEEVPPGEPAPPATTATADTVTIGPAHPAPPAARAAKPKSRKGRASVPSWDEILFGATRPDDTP